MREEVNEETGLHNLPEPQATETHSTAQKVDQGFVYGLSGDSKAIPDLDPKDKEEISAAAWISVRNFEPHLKDGKNRFHFR